MDVNQYFASFANYILNKTVIICNNVNLRICEIEFYLKSDDHKDPYVHDLAEQHTYSNWYFHRYNNGTYKNGTFKGLDITFGDKSKAFGILIRSIYHPIDKIIEGPCKTVNKLLELFEVKSIMDFTDNKTMSIFNDKLKLVEMPDYDTQTIIRGPRIGLSNKNIEYQNKDYRFAIKGMIKKKVKSMH